MKILHHYKVTKSVLPRFMRLVDYEETYCKDVHDKIDRLIITDLETQVSVPWRNAIIVRAELTINGVFNESRARNVGMHYAQKNGYDWLIDGDCDRVLLSFPTDQIATELDVTQIPYYGAAQHETSEALDQKWKTGSLKVSNASFFVISRAVLSSVRFCEQFKFNRFEDYDFYFTMCPSFGFRIDPSGKGIGTAIHLWHSEAERGYAYENENEKLYRKRQELYLKLKTEHGGTLPRKTPEECP